MEFIAHDTEPLNMKILTFDFWPILKINFQCLVASRMGDFYKEYTEGPRLSLILFSHEFCPLYATRVLFCVKHPFASQKEDITSRKLGLLDVAL